MALRNNFAVSSSNQEFSRINLNRRAFIENTASTLMFDIKYLGFRSGADEAGHAILGRDAHSTDADEGRFGMFIQSTGRTYFFHVNASPTNLELGNFPATGNNLTITITKSMTNLISIYYDSQLVGSFQGGTRWQSSNTIIGKYTNTTAGVHKSPIATYDNIKIFNYELSPDEVAHYAKRYMEGTERGLTCLFQFEEGSGTTIVDKSPSKIYGALTNMTYVPAEVDLYLYKTLLLSNNKTYSIKNSGYTPNVIPAMTSNTTPSGIASASGYYGSDLPYKAFDHSFGNRPQWFVNSTKPIGGHWLQYKFDQPKCINKIKLYSIMIRTGQHTIKEFYFQGSNDGSAYKTLFSNTHPNSAEGIDYFFQNDNYYLYYKIVIQNSYGNQNEAGVYELEMFEFNERQLITLSDSSKNIFIDYGNEKVEYEKFLGEKFINNHSMSLGSGKTFEHTVDLSKRRIDKIVLEYRD